MTSTHDAEVTQPLAGALVLINRLSLSHCPPHVPSTVYNGSHSSLQIVGVNGLTTDHRGVESEGTASSPTSCMC